MSLSEACGVVFARPVTSQEKVTMTIMVRFSNLCKFPSHTKKISLGFTKNHTDTFSQLRKNTVDKAFLEVSRLEKRLSRLTQALSSLPVDQIQPGASKLWPLGWQGDQRREIEQSIVSWQDDGSVLRCPFCQQDFSNYSFRRHHCRTCGRVVCGDPATACSIDVGLTVLSSKIIP
jgi:rabenosyn-5